MHNPEREEYLPRDFIETGDGLIFALIDESNRENETVTGWLRYRRSQNGLRKLNTNDAIQWMQKTKKKWVVKTDRHDAELHIIPKDEIVEHYKPEACLKKILDRRRVEIDPVLVDVAEACEALGWAANCSKVGITGSCLIGAQNETSDIDFVLYDSEILRQSRKHILQLSKPEHSQRQLRPLSNEEYRHSWIRRACPGELDNYIWHERRKGTQAVIHKRKIDLALVQPGFMKKALVQHGQKIGRRQLICRVTDAREAFHQPAVYHTDHEEVGVIYCFTHTYVGQAFENEVIDVQGMVEQCADGKRMIVGTSREAEGEYIRVIS